MSITILTETPTPPRRAYAKTLPISLPASRRIGGGEAVTGDPPFAVVALFENEQLLIRFSTGRSGGIDLLGAGRVRANERPLRRHYYDFRDGEPDLERDRLEHGIIGLTHRHLAD
jgi:hypothetical protein